MPVDFNLGVTSMDMEVDYPNTLLGDALSAETPDLSDAFIDQITHDSDGSRDEMGFQAATTPSSSMASTQSPTPVRRSSSPTTYGLDPESGAQHHRSRWDRWFQAQFCIQPEG